jgi:hypothetical protein
MSLHTAAKYLASKGRDGDSMLVHMTPGEVKGLQSLALAHGGSLSINPDTGLVEASFLKRILPTIAGIGLNAMFPGSGALIGLGIGGLEAARTGDIGKGLMAGLGAYGGANLGQALSTAGAEALTGAAQTSALSAPTAEATTAYQQAMESGLSGDAAQKAFMDASNIPQPSYGQQLMAGAKQAFSNPTAAMDFGKQNLMNIGAAAAPMLGDAMTPKTEPIPGAPEEEEKYKTAPYRYTLASNFSGYTPARPNPFYRPTGLGYAAGGIADDEPSGDDALADGGIAAYAAGGIPGYSNRGIVTGIGKEPKALRIGEGIARDTDDDTASLGAYDAAKKRMEKQYAAANLKAVDMPKTNIDKLGQIKTGIAAAAGGSIGGYSDGGRMLKGPGDGMSDSIPAVIGKRQPARLADGEFVVPADVVSHLGNGSTDAGAKKLYGMMDKIRKARTGKKKQAPAVKADKFIPA